MRYVEGWWAGEEEGLRCFTEVTTNGKTGKGWVWSQRVHGQSKLHGDPVSAGRVLAWHA